MKLQTLFFVAILCIPLLIAFNPAIATDEKVNAILCFSVIGLFYSLRNTQLGFLWRWTKLFFFVLFATLLANYLKKEIKQWLNKD